MDHCSIAASALLVALAGCTEPHRSSSEPAANVETSDLLQAAPASAAAPAQATPAVPAIASSSAAPPRLTVAPDGLRWFLQPNGSSHALPFGKPKDEVLASLQKVRGMAANSINSDCGAGPAAFAGWPDGLSLLFQDGRFVGWGLDRRSQRGVRTADGIGIGSTRAELAGAIGPSLQVRKTTLGTEFTAGEYHGLFDNGRPEARITDMWAGVSCVAR
ncbi:hypothetical protein ACOYW6_07695 [Parablastomonas sp. CN1-191]|uniref:hypothetical protein n=1 Tax=Parablastomonas sp. CN1-191 TaxID=3400908 RepID=UPI003BF833B9